jgi:Rap1a immunity proteins
MKNAFALLLVVLMNTYVWSQNANAVESARDLASYCQKLDRGTKGAAQNTKEALLCWGYMQAMQDLSVLAYEDGTRIMGSCPPEQTTVLQLIRSFVTYARTHSEELEGNTAVAVFKALQDAYPCRQITSPR